VGVSLGDERAMPAASRVLVLVVLVLVAGCGGGDRLSREAFVSEAEAICDDFDQRVNAVDEPQNADDVERYVNEVRPVVEDGINELKELQPPGEFEEQWNELVAKNEESLEALDDLAQAAADRDEARFEEVTEDASRRDEESDRIAQGLGLQKCAS
jgi:Tfp pilus assembly protein PilP